MPLIDDKSLKAFQHLFGPKKLKIIRTQMKKYIYIKKLQKDDNEGIVKSNIKYWHSKDFNLKDKEPQNFIKIISSQIENVITDMDWDTKNQKTKITSMWAIINKGSANVRHHHGNSTISAAYYVRILENSGDIVFYDPRPAPVYSHQVQTNQIC